MRQYRLTWVDWAVAGAALALTEQEVWLPLGRGLSHGVGPVWCLGIVTAIASGALLWRRNRPLGAVILVNATLISYYVAFGAPDGLVSFLAPVAALYAAGRYGSVIELVAGTGVTALSLGIHTVEDPQRGFPVGPNILFWVAVLGSGLLGLLLANRSRAIGLLAGRAELLERVRDIEAREAVMAERRRIASELHDLVGHGISLMVLQVEGAQAVLEKGDQHSVAQRLDRLSDTARLTMTEMRRLLTVVGDEPPLLHPQPGIGELQSLVDRVQAEGVPVELSVDLRGFEVPTSVGIAAYRVVLEGLTNVFKHAGPGTPTSVQVMAGPDFITIEVHDSGRSTRGPLEVGRGLAGMRERVSVFGGDLHFGPGDNGGFALRATLPFDALAT